MDLTQLIFEVIDMRSFSNLWYWIALAVLWSTASHYVLGVPIDLALKAQRKGGQKMADLEDLVRINVSRLVGIAEVAGLFIVGIVAMLLTLLIVLGLVYGVEFAQALMFMAVPMTVVFLMSLRLAHRFNAQMPRGAELVRALRRHRLKTQVIGMVSIFITAIWGMYQNLATGPLGG